MKRRQFLLVIAVLLLSKSSKQDIYLHNMRGSNNRLNEKSATRANNNRLFDSQNNDRGGYNVGDATNKPFTTESEQYQMKYLLSGTKGKSLLTIEWTAQHGCGGNENTDPTKQNCELILQYMCRPHDDDNESNSLDRLRDGLTTLNQDYADRQNDSEDSKGAKARKAQAVKLDRGLQENWEYYDACRYRERNKGLFTADQRLKNNNKGYSSATFTRQNPNGARSGYECVEERDFYPYWHPSMWRDIAVLTSNESLCNKYYAAESFNVKPKHLCVEEYDENAETGTTRLRKHWSRWNNEAECVNNGGKWTQFWNYLEKATQHTTQATCESANANQNGLRYKWALAYDPTNMNGVEECLVLLDAPTCRQAVWSRSNHLGNTRDARPSNFTWTLPYFPSNKLQKCVFRIRYNISTDDYDPFNTNASHNGINSPIKTNPAVKIGVNNQLLRLAINTAQYGRVFQDRSHTFLLMPRSQQSVDNDATIYNLNVRGKRGNIVQVYPAVEYDFIPNELTMNTQDLVHIQWTGSNTHNNGNPGGDGQTGDDGQGQTGTDRSNLVQVGGAGENYPLPFEITDMWKDAQLIGMFTSDGKLERRDGDVSRDLALYFASSAYFRCVSAQTCAASYEKAEKNLDADLNGASASVAGALLRFKQPGKRYDYISSRNNNFSNRSQKGKIQIV